MLTLNISTERITFMKPVFHYYFPAWAVSNAVNHISVRGAGERCLKCRNLPTWVHHNEMRHGEGGGGGGGGGGGTSRTHAEDGGIGSE